MQTHLAVAIRKSRRAAGLTQEQLGRRLGLRGRAVYRWERGDSVPSRRNRKALVVALDAVNRDAAAQLAAVLAREAPPRGAPPPAPATPPAPAPPELSAPVALELAIFHMADELDLPPRRVRGPLVRLFKRLRSTHFTLDTAQKQVEAWITSAP